MKLESFSKFLANGGQLKAGFRACAIHPSSEVDLVDVGSYRLGVGAVIPLSPTAPTELRAVRRAPLAMFNPGDADDIGQQLVLQLYEECDELVAPGPRMPLSRAGTVVAASLGAAVGAANLILRVPFQGRRMACVRFKRNTALADLSLVVVGASYGFKKDALGQSGLYVEKTTETWWDGGGVAPQVAAGVPLAGQLEVRQLYVGGFGDGAEAFDELQFYVFGAAGGDAEVTVEAYGER
jgi:hypothetical protein